MLGNTLTLRQVLNTLQASVNENLTEEQLLDMPIKVKIPHSSAQYSTHSPVCACRTNKKTEYSKAEQRVTVIAQWIELDTNPIT